MTVHAVARLDVEFGGYMKKIGLTLLTGTVAGVLRWAVPKIIEWREDNRTVRGEIRATRQNSETGEWLVAVENDSGEIINVIWRDRSMRPRQGDRVVLYTPVDPTGHVRGCKVRKAPGQPYRTAWMLTRTEWQREENKRRDEEDAMHRAALEHAQQQAEARKATLRPEFVAWIDEVSRPDNAFDELEAVRQCELAAALIEAAHDRTALDTLRNDETRHNALYRWNERLSACLDNRRSAVRVAIAEFPEDMEPSFDLAERFVPAPVLSGDTHDTRFDLIHDVAVDTGGTLSLVNPRKYRDASGIAAILIRYQLANSVQEEELLRRHVAARKAAELLALEDEVPNRTVHVYIVDTSEQLILIGAGSEGRGQATHLTRKAAFVADALGVELSVETQTV